MPSREVIVRETLLTDNLTYTAADDRETKRLVRTIRLEGDERLQADGTSTFTITATSPEVHLTADQWHTLIAASRCALLALEKAGKPLPEAGLTANLAQRGFTAEHVRDAVNLLRAEKVAARRDGVITDLTGTGGRAKRRLSAASLTPRTTAPSTPAPSTPAANRPRMDVGRLIEHPDKRVDMGKRMRAQAEQMPSASFEVGDTAKPTVRKDEKKSPVAIPDSAVVEYKTAILDAFARTGKVTATWGELGVKRPALGDLPEGVTPAMVADLAIAKMHASGEIRASKSSRTFTYVPAEKAVAALTKWLPGAALPGKTITVAALAQREDVQKLTPSGWAPETIGRLALDAVAVSGALVTVDGGWMKPAPEVVEKKTAPAPAPKVDTKPVKPEPAKSGVPTPAQHAVSAPALEKKVDTLTDAVVRVERKLDTLPPPPTAEKVLLDEADSAVKSLLESVCVRLKVDGAMTEGAIHRALPGKSKPSRVNPNPVDKRLRLGEALALGVDARILDFDHVTRKYRLITVTNLMPKTELERRVKRIEDMRKAA